MRLCRSWTRLKLGSGNGFEKFLSFSQVFLLSCCWPLASGWQFCSANCIGTKLRSSYQASSSRSSLAWCYTRLYRTFFQRRTVNSRKRLKNLPEPTRNQRLKQRMQAMTFQNVISSNETERYAFSCIYYCTE